MANTLNSTLEIHPPTSSNEVSGDLIDKSNIITNNVKSVPWEQLLQGFREKLPLLIPSPDSEDGIKLRCDFLEVTKQYLKSLTNHNAEEIGVWIVLVDFYQQILTREKTRTDFFEIYDGRKSEAHTLALFLRTDSFFDQDFLMTLIGKNQEEKDILSMKTVSSFISLLDTSGSPIRSQIYK